MVRELRLEVDFPQCTPQEFLEVIFKDEATTKIYHKLNSSEEGATVTPWENGTRIVEFYKEMQLPAPISSLFSSNKIPIKEVQQLSQNGEEFTVSSTPDVQIRIGPKLTGTTAVTVRPSGQGSQLMIVITCEASGPWGMINLIESYMIEEARAGVDAFVVFCETRVAESKLETLSSDERDRGEAEEREEDTESLAFYDVQYDTLSQCSFAERGVLESRDSNGMLTTEALLFNHIKRLEEELKISSQGMEAVMKKLDSLEASIARHQRNTVMAVTGLSAVSLALMGAFVFMKYSSSSGH